jgi:hypothetical protein
LIGGIEENHENINLYSRSAVDIRTACFRRVTTVLNRAEEPVSNEHGVYLVFVPTVSDRTLRTIAYTALDHKCASLTYFVIAVGKGKVTNSMEQSPS